MPTSQPYQSWKGNTYGVVNGEGKYFTMNAHSVPSYSNPKQAPSLETYSGPFGRPKPLKLYRKQLMPLGTTSSRASIGNIMDVPGGAINIGRNPESGCPTCDDQPTNHILVYKGDKGECHRCYKSDCNYDGGSFRCFRSTEGNIGYRPASTIVSKSYYQSMGSYLRSRGKTYDQNLSRNPIPTINYSTSPNQSYNMGTCEVCPRSESTTVFKPNNKKFRVQGAVSSSSRTDRLKLDTTKTTAKSWFDTDTYKNSGSGQQMKKFIAEPCVDCY